jgi:hypothetical protein
MATLEELLGLDRDYPSVEDVRNPTSGFNQKVWETIRQNPKCGQRLLRETFFPGNNLLMDKVKKDKTLLQKTPGLKRRLERDRWAINSSVRCLERKDRIQVPKRDQYVAVDPETSEGAKEPREGLEKVMHEFQTPRRPQGPSEVVTGEMTPVVGYLKEVTAQGGHPEVVTLETLLPWFGTHNMGKVKDPRKLSSRILTALVTQGILERIGVRSGVYRFKKG